MANFKLEMNFGQDQREVKADQFEVRDGWLIFYRKPPEGGPGREYWRVQLSAVVSMETRP